MLRRNTGGTRTVAVHGIVSPGNPGAIAAEESTGCQEQARRQHGPSQVIDPVIYFCFSHFHKSLKLDFLPYIKMPTL